MNSKTITVIVVAIVVLLGIFLLSRKTPNETTNTIQSDSQSDSPANNETNSTATSVETPPTATSTPTPAPSDALVAPLSNASTRMTKKSFGTYVTPKNSPVAPEVFTGFHTGVDFETTAEEKDIDVPINAICTGKLIVKARATGYGGYIVQACTINNKAVTVVYGHLRQSSIKSGVGTMLNAGDTIGVLGTGYSTETDNERKHLHLSIHIGSGTNIKGYVQSKSELSGWMDPKLVLGL